MAAARDRHFSHSVVRRKVDLGWNRGSGTRWAAGRADWAWAEAVLFNQAEAMRLHQEEVAGLSFGPGLRPKQCDCTRRRWRGSALDQGFLQMQDNLKEHR
ncbi:hypothetical protein U9M48_039385 [Paspalum notatum var. saurae]|uniref:Uncharacterized protein n=1 Tax=Paspalum notatum var. saurae TaxID=547442 RepID=A0AAQ3UJJ7_PASNO